MTKQNRRRAIGSILPLSKNKKPMETFQTK